MLYYTVPQAHRARALRGATSATVIAAALMAAGAAQAQTQAQSTLDEVVVTGQAPEGLRLQDPSSATRTGVSILQTPATVQVLTGDLLRERNVINLYQAETQAPGVTSQSTPGNGLGGLAYRGFVGVGSVMTLYDGIQLAVASGTTTFPFDSWNVERVEFLGGPATVLYGFGGVGGTVNIVPRKPNTRMMSNAVEVGYGSFNTFRQALDSTGPLADKWSYRFDISHVTSDGYVDRGSSRSLAASATIQFDPLPNLRFTFRDDYGNIEPMNYWGTPLINGVFNPAIRKKNYEVASDPIRFLDNYAHLKTEWSVNPDITVLNDLYDLKAYRHWRQLTNYVYNAPSAAFPNGSVNRTSYREVFHHETQIGDLLNVTIKSKFGTMDNALSVGGEFKNIDYTPANNTPFSGSSDVDVFNPVPGAFNYGVGTHNQFHTVTNHAAVFAEDHLTITPQFSVSGGIRYDNMLLHYTDLTVGKAWYDKFANFRRDFTPTSWRLGAVYAPTPNLSLYAQYATGADALGNLVSTSYTQKDFDLAKARQIEIGAKQSFWQGRGEWTLSAYNIVKKNLLAPDPNNPTVSIQVGQQSSRGIEASLSLQLGHGVGIQANGTVLKAKFDSFSELVSGVPVSRNGNLPPFATNSSANLFGTWDITRQWQARGGVQYVGDRYANNANTFLLPSYTIANLGLRWRPVQKLTIDAKVENLFDKDYATTGVNGFSQYILGPPRSFYVTLGYTF